MTLASVNLRDLFANRPVAGIAGRSFFATDTNTLYRDNGASWDFIATLTVGGVSVKSSAYTLVATDNLTMVVANSSSAITLTLPASPPSATWNVEITNIGLGACTVARNGLNIDGVAANVTLSTNQGVSVSTDGANYFTMRGLGSGGGGGLSVTTKGDLQTFASSAARLAVGSDATVLTADSTQATGLKWGAVAAYGGVKVLTASYTALASDAGKLLVFNSATAVTLTMPTSGLSSVWAVEVQNVGAGALTVVPGSVATNGGAMPFLPPLGYTARAYASGANTGVTVWDALFPYAQRLDLNYTVISNSVAGVSLVALKTAAGTYSAVQTISGTCTTAASTVSITFASNVTAGNTIVVCGAYGWNGGGSVTVSDSLGNTFTARTNGQYGSTEVYTAQNVTGGACTVTMTVTNGSAVSVVAIEYSGLTSTPFDVAAVQASSSSAGFSPNITTTQANDLIIAVAGDSSCHLTVFGNRYSNTLLDYLTTNLNLTQNQGLNLFSDGFNFYSVRGSLPLTTKGDLQTFGMSAPARLGVGTDGYILKADSTQANGIKWDVRGLSMLSLYSPTVPLIAGFTAVNQGSMTFVNKTNRMLITMPDSYTSVIGRFLVSTTSLPSAPYTVDLCGACFQYGSGGNGAMLGIGLFDGSNNSVGFADYINPTGAPLHQRMAWSAAGAISASSSKSHNQSGNALFFLRITDDGTTRSFYGSVNGLDWIAYGTEATNTGVTPTKPGIMLYNNGGGNGGVAIMQIYHFLVTGSILPQFGA